MPWTTDGASLRRDRFDDGTMLDRSTNLTTVLTMTPHHAELFAASPQASVAKIPPLLGFREDDRARKVRSRALQVLSMSTTASRRPRSLHSDELRRRQVWVEGGKKTVLAPRPLQVATSDRTT